MMTATTAMNIFMFFILAVGCEGARVEIHPHHLRVPSTPTNITITCRSSAPITGCQFSWWRQGDMTNRNPVLDMKMGLDSVADPAHLEGKHGYDWRPLLGYSYSGRGLSTGDCGVRMKVEGPMVWLISCRVKSADIWVYEWMDLNADTWEPLPHTLEPREVLVVQGGQASIFLKTQGPLDRCRFNLSAQGYLDFGEGPSSPDSTERYFYHGAGLGGGECGLAFGNIIEEDNGLVLSMIRSLSLHSDDYRLTPLIVARPPTPPVLTARKAGNNVTATCRVQWSRPAPNITWFLGDEVILQDESPGSEDERWSWPWIGGSWSHTISVIVKPQDTGKELKCSVSHMALIRPLEVTKIVQYTVTHVTHSSTSTTIPTPKSTSSNNVTLRITTPAPSTTNSTLRTTPTFSVHQEGPSDLVGGACQNLWAGWIQLQNTCCLKGGDVSQLAKEIGRLTLEAVKSKAEAAHVELEAAKTKAHIEVEAAKSRAKLEEAKTEAAYMELEMANTKIHLELEVAKSKAKLEEANAEMAKTKAQEEVEVARILTRMAQEELDFMRELHLRKLNNTQPLIDVRMED